MQRAFVSCALALAACMTLAACEETVTPRPRADAARADATRADGPGGEGGVGADAASDLAADAPSTGDDSSAPADTSAPASDTTSPDTTAPTAREMLLYDGKGLQYTAADKGFLPLIKPGDPLPASNWSKPHDFYDGEFRLRYIISGPANQSAGKLQVCIWTMGNADGDGKNYFPESCAGQVAHSGVGTTYDTKLVPSQWWKNAGVPLVFAHPERFLIRVVLRGASGCNVTTYNVSNACWGEWPKFQNMKFRVTIVMVAKGATFSGWKNYP